MTSGNYSDHLHGNLLGLVESTLCMCSLVLPMIWRGTISQPLPRSHPWRFLELLEWVPLFRTLPKSPFPFFSLNSELCHPKSRRPLILLGLPLLMCTLESTFKQTSGLIWRLISYVLTYKNGLVYKQLILRQSMIRNIIEGTWNYI